MILATDKRIFCVTCASCKYIYLLLFGTVITGCRYVDCSCRSGTLCRVQLYGSSAFVSRLLLFQINIMCYILGMLILAVNFLLPRVSCRVYVASVT